MPKSENAEALFWDNVSYNSSLAKRRAMPKQKGFLWKMRAGAVLKELEVLDIDIVERTLQRYIKNGLAPKPQRSRGRPTGYAKETAAEVYASYSLMHGSRKLTAKEVKRFREEALSRDIKGLLRGTFFEGEHHLYPAVLWLSKRDKTLQGYGPGEDMRYTLSSKRDVLKGPIRERVLLKGRVPVKKQTPEEMFRILCQLMPIGETEERRASEQLADWLKKRRKEE